MLGRPAPLGTASATAALAPAVAYDPGAVLPTLVLGAAAAVVSYTCRRWLWPADALECYRLARAVKVYQQTGLRASLWAHVPGHPKPKMRVCQRPDGLWDLWVFEAPDATGRTAEPMPTFWARFLENLERRTGRPWALEDHDGDPWKVFHPARPLPAPGELPVPTDTLRGDHALLWPAGVHVDHLGQLAETILDLRAAHIAIGGTPGTGKTGLAMHLVGHIMDCHGRTLVATTCEVLDVKRTWPRRLADHPAVLAREINDDPIFARLVQAQAMMMDRYDRAEASGTTLAQLVAAEGHHVVVLEELGELLARFAARPKVRGVKVWSPTNPDGFVGADQVVAVVGSIARMGREAGVHLAGVAQDWNAAQFGESGGAVRRLFIVRTSGWQEPDGARMLALPDAAQLPTTPEGAAIPGRFVVKVEGATTRRLQTYHRTYDDLVARLPVAA